MLVSEDYGTYKWFSRILVILSMTFSSLSLIITIMSYNHQAEKPAAKFFSSLCGTVTSIFFRVFISSVLFAHIPGPAFGVFVSVYFVNLATLTIQRSFRENLELHLVIHLESFWYSYCSSISPFGYARPMVRTKYSFKTNQRYFILICP